MVATKKYHKVALITLLALLFALSFAACDGGNNPSPLAAPRNLQISGTILTWDKVDNASGYIVDIDGAEYETNTNSFDLSILTEAKIYQIKVMAYSFDRNYKDSDWSAEAEYELYLPTEGLLFTLINNGTAYEVSLGTADATDRIVIPDNYCGKPVTSIGNAAFFFCVSLKSIIIPDSVTSIGSNAFSTCSSLTSITIPDSVTTIEYRAFEYCFGLTSIIIPDSITSIGYAAFRYCNSLTSITIPNSVISISKDAFYDTGIFKNAANNSVVYADKWVVGYKDSLSEHVSLKNDTIGLIDYAFNGCSGMTSVTIGSGIKSISDYAFNGCRGMTSVTIGSGVTSIGNYAFNDCSSLTSITIGSSVKSIGLVAFGSCASLTSINVDSLNAYYSSSDGVLFDKAQTVLVCYPCGKPDASYTILGSVTNIGYAAFECCSSLTSITIPDSVTSIGAGAFAGCGLTSVTIGSGIKSISNNAFNACSRLTSVTIPDSVTSIGYAAFEYCSRLTSVTIPDSVTSIGNNAFRSCSSLTSVTIGGGVKSIGDATFFFCNNLTIYAQGSSKPSGWNSSWNNSNRPVIWGCTLSTDKTYVVSFVKSANCIVNLTATNGISAPCRGGYTFGGWSTIEGDLIAAYTAANVNTAPDGTTLYAIWIEI